MLYLHQYMRNVRFALFLSLSNLIILRKKHLDQEGSNLESLAFRTIALPILPPRCLVFVSQYLYIKKL